MTEILLTLLFLAVFLCCVVATYLLVRILKLYIRARDLETMRGYETILRSALPRSKPEDVVRELLPRVRTGPMRRVLSRLSSEGDEEWRGKVRVVAGLLGLDLPSGKSRRKS